MNFSNSEAATEQSRRSRADAVGRRPYEHCRSKKSMCSSEKSRYMS